MSEWNLGGIHMEFRWSLGGIWMILVANGGRWNAAGPSRSLIRLRMEQVFTISYVALGVVLRSNLG